MPRARARPGNLRFVNSRLVAHQQRPSPLEPFRRGPRRPLPPVPANDNHLTLGRRISRIGAGAVVVCLSSVLALLLSD